MEGRVHDEAFVKQLFAEHQALVSATIPQWLALSDQFNQCGRPAYSVVLIELLEHLRAFKDGYRVMTGIASVCRKVAEQVIIPCFIELGGQKAELEKIPSTERTQHFARLLTAVNLDPALKESILSLRKLCGGAVHEPSSSRLLTILDTVLPRTLALTSRVYRELVESLRRQGHGGAPGPALAPNAPQAAAHNNVAINANDWECPACQNLNFARRVHCNRCNAPRPAVALPPHGAPVAPVAAAPAIAHEPPAPVAAHVPGAAHPLHAAPQPARPLPGDWICDSCKNVNFARRDHCHLCAKPRMG